MAAEAWRRGGGDGGGGKGRGGGAGFASVKTWGSAMAICGLIKGHTRARCEQFSRGSVCPAYSMHTPPLWSEVGQLLKCGGSFWLHTAPPLLWDILQHWLHTDPTTLGHSPVLVA